MNVTINLCSERETVGAAVLRIEAGRFIVLALTPDTSVILSGFDAETSRHARAIAAALVDVANELDAALAAEQVPPLEPDAPLWPNLVAAELERLEHAKGPVS